MARIKKIKKISRMIGRCDRIDLPLLNLFNLDAKVDTGAFTSAIHSDNIQVVKDDAGNDVLQFILLDRTHPAYNRKKFTVREFQKKIIKNSFGIAEERYIVKTIVEIFGQKIETEFSLSRRGNLKFPVLLGRKFLQKGRFIVEITKYNLSYKFKLKQNENRDTVEERKTVLDKKTGGSRAAEGS
jgi:hypothetical protein